MKNAHHKSCSGFVHGFGCLVDKLLPLKVGNKKETPQSEYLS